MRPVVPPSSTYDETHYPHRSFAACHPDRLAVIATLSGLSPAPIEHARILEIGCGTGGNLLPIASTLPLARFVGIDPSVSQIRKAKSLADTLGLENVTLSAEGVEQFQSDSEFDYVLCHGVFSWVAPATQHALLSAIARCLAPNGVAYLSHTSLPGWRERQIVRDIARFHVGITNDTPAGHSHDGALDRGHVLATSVREIVAHVARAVPDELRGHAERLHSEYERLIVADDAYIVHEHLADHAEPILLADLARHAREVGLEFIGDAIPHRFSLATAAPELVELTRNRDLVTTQQYLDFATNTAFRQSLFIRSPARLERDPSKVRTLWVMAKLRPTRDVDLSSSAPEWFEGRDGGVSLDLPIAKAAVLELLKAAPHAIRFDDLVNRAIQRLPAAERHASDHAETLAGELSALFDETDQIELRTHHPAFVAQASALPLACPHARHQATAGGVVTNRWHHEVRFEDPLVLSVLSRLDGTRSVSDVAHELHDELLGARSVAERRSPSSIENAAEVDGAPLVELVAMTVQMLAWNALILG